MTFTIEVFNPEELVVEDITLTFVKVKDFMYLRHVPISPSSSPPSVHTHNVSVKTDREGLSVSQKLNSTRVSESC